MRRKVAVLREHCATEGRDPADVHVSHLSTATVLPPGADRPHADAGSLEEQVGRYRALAEAGVRTAIVAIPELGVDPNALERAAGLVAAFRP